MPFPDEAFTRGGVVVAPYDERWAPMGEALVASLQALLPSAVAVDHIGSTSVPGLAAKDCLDVMVQVAALDGSAAAALAAAGYRQRPEEWNHHETSYGVPHVKQVFAPPVGGRSVNIHVRVAGGMNVRYALLFRDHLRAVPEVADAWGRFKTRLAQDVPDLAAYGQVKAPAQEVLMWGAERWATETGWSL